MTTATRMDVFTNFRTAKRAAEDAIALVRDAAVDWLVEEIKRNVRICELAGVGEETMDGLVFSIAINAQYRSPEDFSPACLLRNCDIDEARDVVAQSLLEMHPSSKRVTVKREQGAFFGKIAFTVCFNEFPF